MLITLSGRKRVGKDTVANILVKNFKFTKIALADPLRELCSKIFDIPVETFLSDELKEEPFERPVIFNDDHLGHLEMIIDKELGFKVEYLEHNALYNYLGTEFNNPRQMLQIIGTGVVRGCIDDNIFLKLADKRIEAIGKNIVVSDVRFKLEQEWAKNKGAMMCLIKRPNLNLKQDTHRSENELDNEDNFNIIMHNDVHLSRFEIEVADYFNELMRKKGKQ